MADKTPTKTTSGRKFLGAVAVPANIDTMSKEELHAYAVKLVNAIADSLDARDAAEAAAKKGSKI